MKFKFKSLHLLILGLTISYIDIISCQEIDQVIRKDSIQLLPKEFSFNIKTGDVQGAYFLKFIKIRTHIGDSLENLENAKVSKEMLKKVNKHRLKSKEYDAVNVSPNRRYCLAGKENSYKVYYLDFFNSSGKLLGSYDFRSQYIDHIDYNSHSNFLCGYGMTGDFCFLSLNGKLIRKGNFNELTGDSGTSYWLPNISETGKVWILTNNQSFIYDDNSNLIDTIPSAHCTFINEKTNQIFYLSGNYMGVYNYKLKRDEYICKQSNITWSNIKGKYLDVSFVGSKKRFRYEVKFNKNIK